MAQLDYRPIAGPDFSNSMQGITAANEMIQRALGTAQAGVSQFEGIQKDNASKELLSRLLSYQDPEAYKAARAAGTLTTGIDDRYLSQEDLLRTDARDGQLINKATNQIQFEALKTSDARNREQTAASDAAKPFMFQALTLANSGDKAGADKIIADNPGIFGKITIDQLRSAMANNTDLATSNRKFGWADVDRKWELTQRDWTLEDRNTANAAVAAYQQVLANSGNEQDAEAFLRQQNFAPKVELAVRERLGLKAFPTFATDLLGGAVGGTAGGDFQMADPQKAVASTLTAGGLSAPVVAGFLGNFHIEGGYTGKSGDGGVANGIAQWHPDRLANFKAATGVDYQRSTAADQAKFVLWELNNPAKAGMTQAQADAIKAAKTPEEAARLIDKHFERSSGKAVNGRVAAANQAAALLGGAVDRSLEDYNASDKIGVSTAQSNALRFSKTQLDSTPLATVVAELKKGTFPQASDNKILGAIQEIQSRAKAKNVTLTNRTAADILASSITTQGFWSNVEDAINPYAWAGMGGRDFGGNIETDFEKVDKMIDDAAPKAKANPDGSRTSNNQDAVKGVTFLQAQAGLRDQATQAVTQAQAALNQVLAARAAGRNVNPAPYVMRLERAQAFLTEVRQAGNQAPGAPEPTNSFDNYIMTNRDNGRGPVRNQPLPAGFGLTRR